MLPRFDRSGHCDPIRVAMWPIPGHTSNRGTELELEIRVV